MRPLWTAASLLFALLPLSASAAPFIFYRGVLNAASFAPQGLPNGAIAQGSIFSLFGRELGPAEGVQVSAFPLETSLAGVSLEVCQGDSCVAAIPLFVRADQINAIMPSNAPLGPSSVRVSFDGQAGNFSPIEVTSSSVGLFSVSSAGSGPGVIQNFVSQTNQPVNSGLVTARPGQVVTLWATGLGPALDADNVPPQPGELPVDVEIWVGNARVTNKLYSGRSPCCSGVDQIVFEIPADTPAGCWVPVHVRTEGRKVSNGVTMAIGQETCRDAHNPFQPTLTAGGKLAAFLGDRFETAVDVKGLPGRTDRTEWAQVYFRRERAGGFASDRILSLPPLGSCATYGLAGDSVREPPPPSPPTAGWLDAGPQIVFAGDGDTLTVDAEAIGPGAFVVGAANPDRAYLAEGVERGFTGAGGADVGAVNASIRVGPRPIWTNQAAVREIVAGAPLSITWSAPDAAGRYVSIVGAAVNVTNNATGRFHCLGEASAGAFTVPGWATANLPATNSLLFEADAVVAVGLSSQSAAGPVTGEGLDVGAAVFTGWVASTVDVTRSAP